MVKPSRENKGKYRVSVKCDNYTVIDIETTGLDPRFDEIIELGAIRYRDDQEELRFQTLVKPSKSIPLFIEELTGISNEMVAEAPSLDVVLPGYLSFIGDDILLGHNVNFDINFIYDETQRHGFPNFQNDYMDTMYLSRRLFKDQTTHKLSAVCQHLNVPQTEEHRVLADCIRTHLCYQAMKQYCLDTGVSPILPWEGRELHAKSILAQTDIFNEDGPIYQQVFVFTGILERMTRQEAMQAVVNCGGFVGGSVTKKTNYLVLGNNDYCSTIKDGKSSKQKKAEKMQLAGLDIMTISESVFYDMLQDSALPVKVMEGATSLKNYGGEQLKYFPWEYICIDVKTTGPKADRDELIEISAIHVVSKKIIDKFSSFVKPSLSYPIPQRIEKLTGISNDMLQDAPSLESVIPQFYSFIEDHILVGHNVKFDIEFLYYACGKCGLNLNNDFIDTLQISREVLPNLKHHRLSDILEFYGLEQDTAHRAENDAMSTMMCFEKMRWGLKRNADEYWAERALETLKKAHKYGKHSWEVTRKDKL